MEIHQHRGGLSRTHRKLEQRTLVVGFAGGSITDSRSGCNWPEPVIAWLVETFPAARIHEENMAIGATGSESAVFRAQRDLIDRDCDLVFIEYAVNDQGLPPQKRRRTREGLLRKLLAGEGRDVVLVHTYSQAMYQDIVAGREGASIAEFEQLAEHYAIGSVWAGLHAFRELQAGRMRWEQWLPDGVHPSARGSLSYAQSVTAFLQRELIDAPHPRAIPAGGDLPAPLDPLNWETAARVPFDRVKLTGPWAVRRWAMNEWIDQVLDTAAVGATMSFTFEGRVLSLGLDFGKDSADFRWRLDGGDWQTVALDRPPWCGGSGWFRFVTLRDDLPPHRHDAEIEVIHGDRPECSGTNFRVAYIGVVP